MSSGEIIQNTAGAKTLQDTIQTDLVARGYAQEGDEVMAEFVFVMVCNNKSPAQINAELQDLIGPDFDVAFTTWLFNTVAEQYPHSKPALQYGPPKPKQEEPEMNERSNKGASRGIRGGSGVFGNAIAGVKRPNDGSSGRDSQRQRMDIPPNAPTGPRNPGPTDGDPSGGIPTKRGMHRDGQPLFDRLGPQVYNQQIQPQGMMGGPGFFPMMPDMVQMQIDQVTGHRGRNGNNRQQQQQQPQMMAFSAGPGQPPQMAFFPFPGAPPQFMPFPAGGAPPNAFYPQGFPPQQPMISPNGTPQQANGFMPPPFQQQQQPQQPMNHFQQQHLQQQAELAARPVPTKPTNEALCKHATECTNAYCKYAHPSPAATKESGLVLSSEPCEKQLECKDPDCSSSHVSPQAADPANSVSSGNVDGGFKQNGGAPYHRPAAHVEKSPVHCKFGAACTRPDCMFTHPWDSKPRASGSVNLTPCRFGAACTRADCHFSHPPSRRLNKSALGSSANRSATFNSASSPAAPTTPGGTTLTSDDVAAKLKSTQEEKEKLSERMKRFASKESLDPSKSTAADAGSAPLTAENKNTEDALKSSSYHPAHVESATLGNGLQDKQGVAPPQ